MLTRINKEQGRRIYNELKKSCENLRTEGYTYYEIFAYLRHYQENLSKYSIIDLEFAYSLDSLKNQYFDLYIEYND